MGSLSMKVIHKRSGQLYTVEVIIAIVIMIGFSIFISGIYRVRSSKVMASAEVRHLGEDALGALDQAGQLSSWVCSNPPNLTALDDALSQLLPSTLAYNVYVLDVNLNLIDGAYVSHGSPDGMNVVVVLYLVSGFEGNYEPRVVKLELWYVEG